MNGKQIFEGINNLETVLSLVPFVFVLQSAEDQDIQIWGWGLLPIIIMPLIVLLGTWIILRVKSGWGSACFIASEVARLVGLVLSFMIWQAIFIFLAGIVVLWTVTLHNWRDIRLGVPLWKSHVGTWVFLMSSVLAGFAVSIMLEGVLEVAPGLWIGCVTETLLTIRLIAEIRSGQLSDYLRLERSGYNPRKSSILKEIASLFLTGLACSLPYAILIIARLLPEGLAEILPIDTGIGCFFSAGIAAIVGLGFAILYRTRLSRVPIVIE